MITEYSSGNDAPLAHSNEFTKKTAAPPNGSEHQAATAADGGNGLSSEAAGQGGVKRERKRRKVAPTQPGGGKMPAHPTSTSPPIPDHLQPQIKTINSLKPAGQAPFPPGTHMDAPSGSKGQMKLSSYFPTLDQGSKDGLEGNQLTGTGAGAGKETGAGAGKETGAGGAGTGAGPSTSALLRQPGSNPRQAPPSLQPPNPCNPNLSNLSILETSYNEMRQKMTQLDWQLQVKDREIGSLNSHLSDTTEQLRVLGSRSLSLGQELEDAKGENERLRAQVEEIRARSEEEKKGAAERDARLRNELCRSLRASAR